MMRFLPLPRRRLDAPRDRLRAGRRGARRRSALGCVVAPGLGGGEADRTGRFAKAELREQKIRQIEEIYSYDLARSNRQ
jgi:hypothetical protein